MTKLVPWRWGRATPFCEVSLTEPVFPGFTRGMTDLFDELTKDVDGTESKNGGDFFNPRLDISETEAALEMKMELPGVDKEDIHISLEEGVLTIQGEKKCEEEKKEENIYRRECVYGTFLRRISLSTEVDVEKIEAVFEKGVLQLSLPKAKTPEKEIHRIAVKEA